MKYFFFSIFLLFTSASLAQYAGLSDARTLAEKGIIVDQSSSSSAGAAVPASADAQEASMYRLDDALIRQEALGIVLKLRGIELPSAYTCRDYFHDAGIAGEWWVCRSAELAADADIVTRANTLFRPRATLTLAEALGIVIKSLNISLSNTSTSTVSGPLPAWQKRIILTIQEKQIPLNIRDSSGRTIALYDARLGTTLSGFDMSHRMTRGEFFQLVIDFLDYQSSSDPLAHCTVYNDGCNSCTVGDEGTICTERVCFWKGIPSCSACENGYTLENNKCVKKQTSCKGLGEIVSNFSLPPEYQISGTCCAGLTSVGSKESDIVGAPNICANIDDGYCDTRYESSYNSPDCRLVMDNFDSSLCQSYFDGCNSCSRTSNGQTICTMMYCAMIARPSYCTAYVPYIPVNQSQDSTFLDNVLKEIRSYTKDLSCTSDSQCQWKLFGSIACGGPSIGIKYSKKNIDMTLFDAKTSYYTNAQMLFNKTYPVFSPCMVMTSPPPLTCLNGLCQ